MTTYSDFSSLLQLGVGVGIGLSLFRAPVDLRVVNLSRTIESDLVVLRDAEMQFAKAKRRDLMDLKFRFIGICDDLNRWQLPFMVAAVVAAVLNLIGLIFATIYADRVADSYEIVAVLTVSVVWFGIEIALLEVLARWKLMGIARDLRNIRTRKAPAVSVA